MPGPSYKVRGLSRRRRPPAKLLHSIVQLLSQAERPMNRLQIITALSKQYRRNDSDFQRQAVVQLQDAVSYGLLKRKSDCYTLRSERLKAIMSTLSAGKKKSQTC